MNPVKKRITLIVDIAHLWTEEDKPWCCANVLGYETPEPNDDTMRVALSFEVDVPMRVDAQQVDCNVVELSE